MALANFFNKAALAAAHVLHDFNHAAFAETVGGHVIGLAFDEAAATAEGEATLDLCARLLARLYPSVALIALGDASEQSVAGGRKAALSEIMRSINPEIEIRPDTYGVTICIVVGDTPFENAGAPTIYVGSNGWIVSVSASQPVGSGISGNPFGAGSAACFGVANVFRYVFAEQLPAGRFDEAFSMSILDLHAGNPEQPNPAWSETDLGNCHLVGLGAIGNGAVWALARAQGISGLLDLVDHEPVDLANLQRYVLAKQSDVDRPKVEMAREELERSTRILARPHCHTWATYLDLCEDWHFDRIAVALDTASHRCDLQACLPRWIVNAWTHPSDLGISRHGFADGRACLMCLYLPKGKVKDRDVIIADELGIGAEYMDIRQRMQQRIPCDAAFLTHVAVAQGIEPELLAQFEGEQVDVFYRKAVCGGLLLQLSGTSGELSREAEVPLAFQSALAGILLAADLVAYSSGLKNDSSPNISRIDLLRPLGRGELSLGQQPNPSPLCICKDSVYVEAYRAKYAVPS